MRELKGPDLLIRALARLRDQHQRNFTATMVGDGTEKHDFVNLANEFGVSRQIRFLPGMAAREAFELGRIMVVPSRAEAFPYIVLEALAAGKSVIASNVGGIPEVFGPQSSALVEPEDEAIANKMLGVADDPTAFRAAMPDLTRLHERFSLQSMAHSIETIYYEAHPDRAVPED